MAAMLREPALYTKLSCDHLTQAAKSLGKHGHHLSSRAGETVLDIGCGPGDVTRHIILPSLHASFSTLIGIDISPDMIQFAKNRWPEENRLKFVTMDAAEPELKRIQYSLPIDKFDKIFSFYALQWVTDRRQLARNVSHFLAPGGQAYLVFVVSSGVYTVWDSMIENKNWIQYFKDVNSPLNEYQYMENPADEVSNCLKKAGLNITTCHIENHKNAFSSNNETDKQKRDRIRSVDPLVCLVPDHLKDKYIADVLQHIKDTVGPKGAVDYTSLAIICEKPI